MENRWWFNFHSENYLQANIYTEFSWVQFCVSEDIQKSEDRAHMYILQHWSREFAR